MKYSIVVSVIIAFIISCNGNNNPIKNGHDKTTAIGSENINTKLQTLIIKGDFNGDGKTESLVQDIADSTGTTVKYLPDTPAEIENDTTNEGWYKYIEFYSNLKYSTRLRTEGITTGDLYFNNSQGLCCLINIGNLNNDKGDEIALVIDRLDQSRHNYCNIFTLCNGTWRKVFTFSIHEDAFNYKQDNIKVFKNIPGALEFKNGKWKYYDYMEMPYENIEDIGQMLPIKVASCNENINLPLTD